MRVLGCGLLVLLALVLVGGVADYLRPVPALAATTVVDSSVSFGSAAALPWPSDPAEGALGAVGMGVLTQTPSQTPQPTASVAKVMTALVLLHQKPLAAGQQGPAIVITNADVAAYQADVAQNQSTVPVAAGEQLSEYEALQAMLIPSGNNIATLLATWAFGSLAAAVAAMNQETTRLGMTSTHFADASGFSPATVSTPVDLVRLGEAAMVDPVIAGVVQQRVATIPVAGDVYNVDSVIGQSGIVGIKTGNSDQQPGAFLFAAPAPVSGAGPVMIVGVVMGAPNLALALQAAPTLLQTAAQNFELQTVFAAGQEVARLKAAWGDLAPIRTDRAITIAVWKGETVKQAVAVRPVSAPVQSGQRLGTVTVKLGAATYQSPLVAGARLGAAPWIWRATRRPPFVPPGDWPG
ncbi:MAG: D-alanyl-D-alanine carboxypeptidase [Candidatus Dormiibacterota bacterium]